MRIITKPNINSLKNYFFASFILMVSCIAGFSQEPIEPMIVGPLDSFTNLPVTLTGNTIANQVYTAQVNGIDAVGTNFEWIVSSAGTITAPDDPTVSNTITVTWTAPSSQQSINVSFIDENQVAQSADLIINWNPFAAAINPASIPQFVDPLPHFAAGLRVNAKAGGSMTISAEKIQQIALSTGTPLLGGVHVGDNATAGMGNYAGYQISYNGTVYPAMWPARTIETQQGKELKVQYLNNLNGVRYSDFNILADQTLMMNGYTLKTNPLTEPYDGPIPMVVHLHGGEMPSNSDGGPNAWFMPSGTTGVNTEGPGFQFNASTLSTYPNEQEATTLWYHPHDDGLTRINVYTGLAGYYLIRGADEETAQLPGWSGDDKVQEVTPDGKSPTFNGTNTYLPEIELGIQDRMFNVNGELFWPVEPTNPAIHPFWTPEFVGDVMVVNGKTWPYLSVAPRKYRFRILEGCNARFLDMWLQAADGTPGPKITVIGGEGGLLETPVDIDPASGKTLLMAPGQRCDVIIDFSAVPGQTFTLMNKANTPYPDGDPVDSETTGRIMQFIVNGNMVSGSDPSKLPTVLRPVNPLVKLTDFAGNLTAGVTPAVKRQLILNEVSTLDGGPAAVLINNSYFESTLAIPGTTLPTSGGPTEIPREGTTEMVQIINISADAHPMHIHLLQWQLVSRQKIDAEGYMDEYAAAWAKSGLDFPSGMGYPGGAGSPYPYDTPNADGAVGGNPPLVNGLTNFTWGPVMPAKPEEQGWKDDVIVMPGEVTTFITRVAPTDRPVNATPEQLLFPFDPSEGPGYVWHCHIVDHEDMSMMRPLPIAPSPLRFPQITVQPLTASTCIGSTAIFSVTATSATTIHYQWEVSMNGTSWAPLAEGSPYSGVSTRILSINPVTLALDNYQYRVVMTNTSGVTTSDAASLTVSSSLPASVTIAFNLNNVCAGTPVTFTATPVNGGTPSYRWYVNDVVKVGETLAVFTYTPIDGDNVKVEMIPTLSCNSLATSNVITMVVKAVPVPTLSNVPPGTITCQSTKVTYTTEPGMTNYVWTYSGILNVDYAIVLGGTALNNSVTIQWLTVGDKTVSVDYTNASGCNAAAPVLSTITVTGKPLKPGIINGSPIVCQSQSNVLYSVPLVAGLTYFWTYSGTGANILSPTANSTYIDFAANATSGTLSVTASNLCGASPAQTFKVTVNPLPAQPGAFIRSTVNPCKTQSKVVYTVPKVSGVTYSWTYSGTGATIISGATTNSITVNFLNATSGILSVKVVNACGSSISRDLTITVNQGCVMKSASIIGEEQNVVIESPIVENTLKVYPNPTSSAVTFEFQISENARVTLDITSTTGTHIGKVFDAFVEAGETKTVFFNQPISAGIYFYYLKWNNQRITGKFIKKE